MRAATVDAVLKLEAENSTGVVSAVAALLAHADRKMRLAALNVLASITTSRQDERSRFRQVRRRSRASHWLVDRCTLVAVAELAEGADEEVRHEAWSLLWQIAAMTTMWLMGSRMDAHADWVSSREVQKASLRKLARAVGKPIDVDPAAPKSTRFPTAEEIAEVRRRCRSCVYFRLGAR